MAGMGGQKSRGSVAMRRQLGKGVVLVLVLLCGLMWWSAARRLFEEPHDPSEHALREEARKDSHSPNTHYLSKAKTTGHFTLCAAENGACKCPKGHHVKFGARDSYITHSVCDDLLPVHCTAQVFGADPIAGEAKECTCTTAPLTLGDKRVTCLKKPSPCIDLSPECKSRATQSGCKGDARVRASCRMSCQLCDAKPAGAKTRDSDEQKMPVRVPESLIQHQVQLMQNEGVIDPEAVRKLSLQKHPDGKRPNPSPGSCKLRNDNFEKLLSKAVMSPRRPGARIMCMSYTMHSKQDAMNAVRETFGPDCDGLIFMSTETSLETQELRVYHVGKEEYNNMWQKSRSIWAYVAALEEKQERFDFFVIGGDDLYVAVDNLRAYVDSENVRNAGGGEGWPKPLFLGRRFKGYDGRIFNSGGAGYVLNRASVKLLARKLDQPECHPTLTHFSEDREVGLCLKTEGVEPHDTRDELGEERFMPFTPDAHYGYRAANYQKDWYKEYAIGLKEGMESMSKQVVSFHYLKPDMMRRLHALLHYCRVPKLSWCAEEGKPCSCPGGVVYGTWSCAFGECKSTAKEGAFDGTCDTATIGSDPAPGVEKACFCTAAA